MPSHCWRSNCRSTPGWVLSNSSSKAPTTSSGTSVPFSQRRSVVASSSLASPSSPPASLSSSEPHAARARTPASPMAASFLFIGGPPLLGLRDAELALQHEHGGAEEDVVLPERAEPEVDVVADRRHGPPADRSHRGVPERSVEGVERP